RAATSSTVLQPTEPVEPRMATRRFPSVIEAFSKIRSIDRTLFLPAQTTIGAGFSLRGLRPHFLRHLVAQPFEPAVGDAEFLKVGDRVEKIGRAAPERTMRFGDGLDDPLFRQPAGIASVRAIDEES